VRSSESKQIHTLTDPPNAALYSVLVHRISLANHGWKQILG
jgi:hypothetical protein